MGRQAWTVEATDPDPFTIGLGIFAAIAGGGTFLEARRTRQEAEGHHKDAYRSAWFASRRTLIFFKRSVDEFETYMLEDGFAKSIFRIGAVRLTVDFGRHKALRRLNGQVMTTAQFMADNLDDLSDFLGVDDQQQIDAILKRLGEIEIPGTYRDLIKLARAASELYSDFLDEIGEREAFPRDANNAQ